ncbi:MAG TPA: hypothetical protein VNK82_03875 [Terriglobales bacterium]|nr:hypothetical protein [Terriglobales bacterium]
MKSYRRIMLGLLAGWFVTVLSASALHLFKNDSNRVGLVVGLTALTPVVAFLLWFAASERMRHFALSLNPRALTLAHSWRIFGFVFILLEARGILPAVFALPAGYGDMFIGVTAPLVAWKLAHRDHRNSFVLWHVLGIVDLVVAVSLGTTASLLSPLGPSTAVMTVLPLSLIPTFVVPLLLIFHVISIAQASAWESARHDEPNAVKPDLLRDVFHRQSGD